MNAYALKRSIDLPLIGRIMRERKGQYVVIVSHASSKRHYADETVCAPNAERVREHIRKLYPTIAFVKGRT